MNTYSDEDPRSVFFLDVTDGQDDIDQETGSRSNDENVSVIVKLVSNMAKRDRSILKDLAIVGFYNRQKWLLMERLCQMAASLDGSPSIENLGVKRPTTIKDLGLKVVNTDGFEGGEAKYVILDHTVTQKLGFLAQNSRYLVAVTRARQFLCMAGSRLMLANEFRSKKEVTPEGDPVQIDTSPMVYRYINALASHRNVFNVKGAKFAQETFSTKDYSSDDGWNEDATGAFGAGEAGEKETDEAGKKDTGVAEEKKADEAGKKETSQLAKHEQELLDLQDTDDHEEDVDRSWD